MFSLYFAGMQQDIKLAVLPPLLCAVFRAIFIYVYGPPSSRDGRRLYHCFRYGFWWGMDWNAYVYLFSLALVTLPGAFFPGYFTVGDTVRLVGVAVYAVVLYAAFAGRMIFYYHFHDIYNRTLWLGKHADKKNLADIFFHQNYGWGILAGLVPFLALCVAIGQGLLSLPSLPWPDIGGVGQYVLNTVMFLGSITLFYYFRFGGTFDHRKKPEWDEVPAIVKDDVFLGKATLDDLVALEIVWKHPAHEALHHSDEESAALMAPVMPTGWQGGDPLRPFRREAAGARIEKPSHIFFLLGEGHAQAPFDALYRHLPLMEGSEAWRKKPHTVTMDNFLSAGLISQPSLTSLLTGVYDADMELNENQAFWQGYLSTSLPRQMKRLGYRTAFWYGGSLTWGSLEHFLPAVGFDVCYGGPDICGASAPRTWLGVYDHLFLQEAARRIREERQDAPVFHFLYTTSNHGPYTIPVEDYGFDAARILAEAPAKLREDPKLRRKMGGIWYADQAVAHFIAEMEAAFPDSLFLLTGDHAVGIFPYDCDLVPRWEPTIRETKLTSFAMSHPDLSPSLFAGNTIGGHMNLLPTLMELIAPRGFSYEALFPSLLDPIDHVVTPYCWMTREEIGIYQDRIAQPLAVSAQMPSTALQTARYEEERTAWCELTGWLVRHPELLTKK